MNGFRRFELWTTLAVVVMLIGFGIVGIGGRPLGVPVIFLGLVVAWIGQARARARKRTAEELSEPPSG
jgi:hypothetical protein